MTNIVLTISEIGNSGRYDAHVEGRYIVTSKVDLAAPLGIAAGLTVNKTKFEHWKGQGTARAGSPILKKHPRASAVTSHRKKRPAKLCGRTLHDPPHRASCRL
jgi:hypothetical protein